MVYPKKASHLDGLRLMAQLDAQLNQFEHANLIYFPIPVCLLTA